MTQSVVIKVYNQFSGHIHFAPEVDWKRSHCLCFVSVGFWQPPDYWRQNRFVSNRLPVPGRILLNRSQTQILIKTVPGSELMTAAKEMGFETPLDSHGVARHTAGFALAGSQSNKT